jgi:uncharacterized phage-associated protein
MTEIKAIELAKWFIKNEYDTPRNTFAGNMKIQKLLFFSQLIHFAKYGNLLFLEEMRAFKNGTVINDVRLSYKESTFSLIEQAKHFSDFDDEEVSETLKLTVEIFGNLSARELSDLNHELQCWKIPYLESQTTIPNYYNSDKNNINLFDSAFTEDIRRVKQMLVAYEESNDSMDFEMINGITFYYDPKEMQFTDEIKEMLEGYNYPEEAYTVTYDEEQGIIIS